MVHCNLRRYKDTVVIKFTIMCLKTLRVYHHGNKAGCLTIKLYLLARTGVNSVVFIALIL